MEAGAAPADMEEEGNDFTYTPNALCWEKLSVLETLWSVMCSDYSKKTKKRFREETEGAGDWKQTLSLEQECLEEKLGGLRTMSK